MTSKRGTGDKPGFGVSKSRPGSRRSSMPTLDSNDEHILAVAEAEGLNVYRGVAIVLAEEESTMFPVGHVICALVPRDTRFSDFVPVAVEKIKKDMRELGVNMVKHNLNNIQFFVGTPKASPAADTTMMQLETDPKTADCNGVVLIQYKK